ncbi:hypothetical protein ACHAW6_010895 [Cyclotella cf. meneghiniana]
MISPTLSPPSRRFSTVAVLRILLPIAIFLCSLLPILLHNETAALHRHDEWHDPRPNIRRQSKQTRVKSIRYHLNETELLLDIHSKQSSLNLTFPPNIGTAGKSLLLHALTPRPVPDSLLNPAYEAERCAKYFSFENNTKAFLSYHNATQHPNNERPPRRRLFLGSLLADDSWHALAAVAMETYGIYAVVAFVESNRTQTGSPRPLRFLQGTTEYDLLMERRIFGPSTRVLLDQFSYEGEVDGGGLIREHRQRAKIIELWKRGGMTVRDVGILTDADETPSRDFLRALQTCDFPELRDEQNCFAPKIVVASNVFEGSPECMTVTRKWMHPDVILGKCIEGIGEKEFQLNVSQRQRAYAWRKDDYSAKYLYRGWPKEKKQFPLWNPADFRRDTGGYEIYYEDVDYLPFRMGHTGFHFHNYFETTHQLRTKYRTYGHPVKTADELAVAQIHPDLDLMTDCVLDRSPEKNKHSTLSTTLAEFEGRIPVAYELNGYSVARHLELRRILTEDERLRKNGTWHETAKAKESEAKSTT